MNIITETIKRFFSANPKYFKIIQIISAIALIIVNAPAYLTGLGVTIPEELITTNPYKAIVTVASVLLALFAQLPNVDPVPTVEDTDKTDA